MITDPRTVDWPALRPAAPPDTTLHERQISGVLPEPERRRVEIERGDNLVPPRRPAPPPTTWRAGS